MENFIFTGHLHMLFKMGVCKISLFVASAVMLYPLKTSVRNGLKKQKQINPLVPGVH